MPKPFRSSLALALGSTLILSACADTRDRWADAWSGLTASLPGTGGMAPAQETAAPLDLSVTYWTGPVQSFEGPRTVLRIRPRDSALPSWSLEVGTRQEVLPADGPRTVKETLRYEGRLDPREAENLAAIIRAAHFFRLPRYDRAPTLLDPHSVRLTIGLDGQRHTVDRITPRAENLKAVTDALDDLVSQVTEAGVTSPLK